MKETLNSKLYILVVIWIVPKSYRKCFSFWSVYDRLLPASPSGAGRIF